MHLEKLQAFVLSNSSYGESDRIVSLFTLEHGRLKGFARGARNSRKRFGPALETFARIYLQLSQRDGLSLLRSADIITLYSGIRRNLPSIAYTLYACELVESMTPEGHPLPRLYRLLSSYLGHLDSVDAVEADRRMFEINLLNILGYRPSLDRCSRCGSEFDDLAALMQHGGELVCRFCTSTGRQMSPTSMRGLSACLTTSCFGRLAFDHEALQEIGILLDESLATHSSRKFKSLDFLRQICG